MFLKNLVFLSLLILAPIAYAKRIKQISVKGNNIIETELILPHIHLKKGRLYSQKTIKEDVRRLFSLGFFDDIEVRRSPSPKGGFNIVYQVKERLHISELEFEGNKNLSDSDLKEMFLVKEYSFLNYAQLKKDILKVQEKYKDKGYYLAEVSYRTKTTKAKKLKLIITIKENKKLFIKKINFIGNRNISSRRLKAFMLTKEKNLLSFIGSGGTFKKENIERDLEYIGYYYRDKGYLNAHVHPPEISITADRRFLYIYFSVTEGPRFKIGEVAYQGDDIVPTKEVMDRLQLKDKEYFSLSLLQKDIQQISTLYKNKGYAFVKIRPQFFPDPSEEDKVHILFQVEDKGHKYKLNRIQLFGNKNIRDKVLLRRFRIKEGDIYNESKKDLSQRLLQQLGYFEKIEIEPVPLGSKKGLLNLNVKVKERERMGEIRASAGYNSQTRLFILGSVKKQGFLGLDQSIMGSVRLSHQDEIVSFSYQSPYFLDSQWNFNFDVFNVGNNTLTGSSNSFPLFSQAQNYYSYFQMNTGFSVSLGYNLIDFLNLFLKYKLQNQNLSYQPVYFLRELPVLSFVFDRIFGEISEGANNQASYPFRDIYNLEEGRGINSSLSAIMEYDKRNDRYYASKGFLARLSAEYSGIGGDFNYSKLEGLFRHYYNPFWKLVLKNRLEYGFVFSNSKEEAVPFTELYLLGGSYNLRGFEWNTQGPRRYSQKAYEYAQQEGISNPHIFANHPYGGTKKFFYSLELEFPLVQTAELRGAFFFDLGEANNSLGFDLEDQLRASVGASIRMRTPFGPISLDWAVPYKPRKDLGEQDWRFHFNIGGNF